MIATDMRTPFHVAGWRERWNARDTRAIEAMIERIFTGYANEGMCNGVVLLDPSVGVLRCRACGASIAQGEFNKPHTRKPPAYLSDFRAVLELILIIKAADPTFEISFEVQRGDGKDSTLRIFVARSWSGYRGHLTRNVSDREMLGSRFSALCQVAIQAILEIYETPVASADFHISAVREIA